jgi:hypothetical protein
MFSRTYNAVKGQEEDTEDLHFMKDFVEYIEDKDKAGLGVCVLKEVEDAVEQSGCTCCTDKCNWPCYPSSSCDDCKSCKETCKDPYHVKKMNYEYKFVEWARYVVEGKAEEGITFNGREDPGERVKSGLKWQCVGDKQPARCQELKNEALAQILLARKAENTKFVELSEDEWKGFGIRELLTSHYVKSGGFYFQSAEVKITFVRDKGHGGKVLKDFYDDQHARIAGLTLGEVYVLSFL